MQQGNAGMWAGYVKNHLLPRLFGFELLMAPYAVAHFKLSLQLAGRDLHESIADQWAYVPEGDDRLGVYLTNTLEEAHKRDGLSLFTQWVADETNAANKVKRDLPVLAVMGNPPYSANSANKGTWITSLIQNDYYPNDHIKEQNPKLLLDDYVKFIRWGQWRIEQSGQGILAFISNNGYLDNPTFRNMRHELLDTFTDIFILNLHGDTRKKECSPDGSLDENVFDIQQGVAIGIFIKDAKKDGTTKIHYADLWGKRQKSKKYTGKYSWLSEHDTQDTDWLEVYPQAPFYLFVPYDIDVANEYEKGERVNDIFNITSTGVKTHRDHFALDFERKALEQRILKFRDLAVSNETIREIYRLRDTLGF